MLLLDRCEWHGSFQVSQYWAPEHVWQGGILRWNNELVEILNNKWIWLESDWTHLLQSLHFLGGLDNTVMLIQLYLCRYGCSYKSRFTPYIFGPCRYTHSILSLQISLKTSRRHVSHSLNFLGGLDNTSTFIQLYLCRYGWETVKVKLIHSPYLLGSLKNMELLAQNYLNKYGWKLGKVKMIQCVILGSTFSNI